MSGNENDLNHDTFDYDLFGDEEFSPEVKAFLDELDAMNKEEDAQVALKEAGQQIDLKGDTPVGELSKEAAETFLEGAATQNNSLEKVPTMKRWLSFIQEKLRALKDKIFGNSKDDR